MDTQLVNNYSQNIDLALQLTINSGFLWLNDLYKLSSVDKFMNFIFKKNIEKYYDILKKCSSVSFIRGIKQHYIINLNWSNILSKKLNRDEMSIYYTYFFFRFNIFYKIDEYSHYWMCVLDQNGFVKSFYDYDINNVFDNTDIILKIQTHYSYLIYGKRKPKLKYWGTRIKFENNYKKINPDFANLKLLDKLIISDKYKNMITKLFSSCN